MRIKRRFFLGITAGLFPILSFGKDKPVNQSKVSIFKKKNGKSVLISGTISHENLVPAEKVLVQIMHDNHSNDESRFLNLGELMTDTEGRYSFETDLPAMFYENGIKKMNRIFFNIIAKNGKKYSTILYFGQSGKPFIDNKHFEMTSEKYREELPKVIQKDEMISKVKFNMYFNS